MRCKRFPEFGKELGRGFPVHAACYDCVEFYDGCDAWPEGKPFSCADYYQLPDVMPGTSGQVFPPSWMRGRKEPRVRQAAGTVGGELEGRPRTRPAPKSGQKPIEESPVARIGDCGERYCGCGVIIAKGRRVCEKCKIERRRVSARKSRKNGATDDASLRTQEGPCLTPGLSAALISTNGTGAG